MALNIAVLAGNGVGKVTCHDLAINRSCLEVINNDAISNYTVLHTLQGTYLATGWLQLQCVQRLRCEERAFTMSAFSR